MDDATSNPSLPMRVSWEIRFYLDDLNSSILKGVLKIASWRTGELTHETLHGKQLIH